MTGEIKATPEPMDPIDGWCFGHVLGSIRADAEKSTSVIDRAALMTDADDVVKPDQLLIEVQGRTYVVSVVRAEVFPGALPGPGA